MTKTPAFLLQDTLEPFRTEKFFKLKQNYDLQPYLKFLQKKLKNWVFALFLRFFAKFSFFFRKIFFFNFFLKNSFLSIFSSFYPILALIPSKCQKLVILFKKIYNDAIVCLFPTKTSKIWFWFIFLGFQRKYSWIFRSKPQIFEIFQKTSIRGANAWGNERVWSENHFSMISSKNHGRGGYPQEGRLPATKSPTFGKNAS